MDPSLLVPDGTFAVAAEGTVDVDFDLPRFGISLVTIQPAGVATDGGSTTLLTRAGTSGCSCTISGRAKGAVDTSAPFGMAMLAHAVIARRRRARMLLHQFT